MLAVTTKFIADGRIALPDQQEPQTFRVWLREQMDNRRQGGRPLGVRELAAYSGVSRSTLSQILTGQSLPGTETIMALAAYLRVEPEPLLAQVAREKAAAWQAKGRQTVRQPEPFLPPFDQLSDDEREIVRIARALPGPWRGEFLAYARDLWAANQRRRRIPPPEAEEREEKEPPIAERGGNG